MSDYLVLSSSVLASKFLYNWKPWMLSEDYRRGVRLDDLDNGIEMKQLIIYFKLDIYLDAAIWVRYYTLVKAFPESLMVSLRCLSEMLLQRVGMQPYWKLFRNFLRNFYNDGKIIHNFNLLLKKSLLKILDGR